MVNEAALLAGRQAKNAVEVGELVEGVQRTKCVPPAPCCSPCDQLTAISSAPLRIRSGGQCSVTWPVACPFEHCMWFMLAAMPGKLCRPLYAHPCILCAFIGRSSGCRYGVNGSGTPLLAAGGWRRRLQDWLIDRASSNRQMRTSPMGQS